MPKLVIRIAIPIILVGVFVILTLFALNYEQFNLSFYIVITLLLVFLFSFGIAIGQNLTSPVKKILDGAQELSKGNWSQRIDVETKDELSELASAFNKIAEELQDDYEQRSEMEKSVAIKVRAQTKEFQETISALEQKVKNRTIELERLTNEINKLRGENKN